MPKQENNLQVTAETSTAVQSDAVNGNGSNLNSDEKEKPILAVNEQVPNEEFKSAYLEKKNKENELDHAIKRRSFILGVGIPYFLFGLIIVAGVERQIYEFFIPYSAIRIESVYIRVLWYWLLLIAIAGTFFYFFVQSRVNRAKWQLKDANDALEIERISSKSGRIPFYREKLSRLTAKTVTVFSDSENYEKAECLRNRVVKILDSLTVNPTAAELSNIETNLTALEEVINREITELKEQKNWQTAAISVITLYILGLITSVIMLKDSDVNALTPVFNVPLSVVMWGAAGSLAAILYRFYTEQGRIRFASEFRWLIARPIIGIIMGAVVYLALVSGLLLLGATVEVPVSSGEGAQQVGRTAVYSIIAFLAGFSDKFYLGVIDLLVARTVKSEEIKPNVIVTETQRIPQQDSIEDSDVHRNE